MLAGSALAALVALFLLVPRLYRAFTTVSTDDAYVSGHVTYVAARVPGQVARVLVDDNNRVHKGDLLVALDKEPYEVRVSIAQAAVTSAQANFDAMLAQTRGLAADARSLRYTLQRAGENVNDQVALLHAKIATLESKKATLARVEVDYKRAEALVKADAASRQQFDNANEARRVAQAEVERAQQEVYQVRVGLGLSPQPPPGEDLASVPRDLQQTYSKVKEAQGKLMQVASRLGVVQPFNVTPEEMLAEFYRRDPDGNVDRILEALVRSAPAVKQAEAKVGEAQRNLDEAQLRLRYCDVVAEIDGVVTRRSVNPGNNIVEGQSLMALRSLSEIWVDANFKETQLASLRIGQPVDLDVDMYGSAKRFQGRISGFANGTGATLALLPPENATGNFVKVVQRLPVRIDLVDYDPNQTPLFVGLSVTPRVHVHETPTGPHAGQVLQPYLAAPEAAKTGQ
ncbi:MAG TPA: HlyD family secretion protein [Myxococcota bacterium]|nr:HlyD family secretion protein [Myxococcota bacterium]